jgi:Na+/H+ antiporter NhaC
MFLKTIPYNFYAILTPIMILILIVKKFEFGPMKEHEKNALEKGDLFTTSDRPYGNADQEMVTPYGKVIDLVFPVVVLIIFCILGMIYTGGFFSGESFVSAFANSDASKGLVFGSFISLVITFCFYIGRGVLTFNEFTKCIPEGFKAMVAPILILTMAWTLSGMTGLLGAKDFVGDMVASSASELQMFLPVCIFLVAVFLAFSTGTSWGTFGILIPIVVNCFQNTDYTLMIISISACMAGAVCGDHCSPISDTTIMSSAGAECVHINHVSSQLPYALTVAVVSAITYIVAGLLRNVWVSLLVGVVLTVFSLFIIKYMIEDEEK